ncbi:MAG: DUF1854 domain-containing protein [Armatimonadetes bacterium]|nr:DUF1854 domain-containing protein [Armatimonadota bacterium]
MDSSRHPGTESAEPTAPRYLDPDQVRVHRGEDGRVYATIGNECSVIGARFMRSHPLTDPDRYLAIIGPDPKGDDFGLLRNWRKLDSDSRAVVEQELERRYLHPVVKSVRSLKQYFGLVVAHFETDRGPREVTLRDIRDNVVYLGQSRLLLTDAEGNRYDIPDIMSLDATSRALLAEVL